MTIEVTGLLVVYPTRVSKQGVPEMKLLIMIVAVVFLLGTAPILIVPALYFLNRALR